MARIYSIRSKFRIVSKYWQSGKILDVGCGTGEFLAYCRKQGFGVEGVEPNEKARNYAQSENSIPVTDSLITLNQQAGTFQCISMWHVLEHVHELTETIARVKSLLDSDGIFIVAVPNCDSWDARKYKHYWAAYDVPRHLYHFTEDTLKYLAAETGFEILNTFPQKLDAYYVSMLSEKYNTGKRNYIKSVAYGFWSNLKAKNRKFGHSSRIFILSSKKR